MSIQIVKKRKTNKDKATKYFHSSLNIEQHVVFKPTLDPFNIHFSCYLMNLLKSQILTFFSMQDRFSLSLSLSLSYSLSLPLWS
jgi:hypothetical protein